VKELQQTKNSRDALELVVEQVKLETKEEKESTDRLEHGLIAEYNPILNNMQAEERSEKENINLIAQKINQYRQVIEELKENINPMNPLEVREKRKE
jgi:hypothetical protein